MKKIVLFCCLTVSLFGGAWSLTMMSIATGAISTTNNTGMNTLTTKQESVNAKYREVREQVEIKNTHTLDLQTLDKNILLELKDINFLISTTKGITR